MFRVVLLLFVTASACFFTSCGPCTCEKVTCPPYDDALFDQWNNYSPGQQLIFRNSVSETDSITIELVNKSPGHEANKGCINAQQGCASYISFYSFQRIQNGQPKLNFSYNSMTGWDNKTTKTISINFKEFQFNAIGISDTGFVFPRPILFSRFNSTLTLNGKTLMNVQQIQRDTNVKQIGVYKVYFSRNSGLVAYEEYPSREIWIRQ